MKKFLAYCRVSTKAQADRDNSLPTQKRIIEDYAQRKELTIVEWFSEAKSGFKGERSEFHRLLETLKNPEIDGVIFHKLDRSSRNVSDFSLLDKLMTQGKKIIVIEGEFDTSRSAGRLAFRNFCNLCVWYSENLSEEVTTKMQEVLLKGYYPGHVPIGYRRGIKGVDQDWKKAYPDEKLAPYVKECFQSFATGEYSIRTICEFMRQRGMRNKAGGFLRKGVFERILRDPFYHGLMAWGKRRGKVRFFEGNHEPIISKELFDRVQNVIDGRTQKVRSNHDFTYSKIIQCECGHFLCAGEHKGNIYWECKNSECKFTSLREDRLEDQIVMNLASFNIDSALLPYYEEAIRRLREKIRNDSKGRRQALNLKVADLDKKLDNLHNAVLSGVFSGDEAVEHKNKIIEERHIARIELDRMENKEENALWDTTFQVIDMLGHIPYRFKQLNPLIKRKLLNFLFVNRQLHGEKLLMQAIPAFEKLIIANNLLFAEKVLVNQQPHGNLSLEQATSVNEKLHLAGEILHGRDGGT